MNASSSGRPIELTGEARPAGPTQAPTACRVVLADADLTILRDGEVPVVAAYRDVTTLSLDQGRGLVVLGRGDLTLILERFGTGLGALAATVRERRARQLLADRLVDLPRDPLPLLEIEYGGARAVAQLAVHPWGLVLIPIDERRPWISLRRSEIGRVDVDGATGTVRLAGADGATQVSFPALGDGAAPLARTIGGLRDGATLDAAAIIGDLMPDAAFGVRQRAAAALVDGRPADRATLGDAWGPVESAFLVDPTFAASCRALQARSGGASAPAWLSLAPVRPGAREAKTWTFVGLPGNLLALELLNEGAHATYFFRTVPRVSYVGEPPASQAAAATATVRDVSNALVDIRFLREPIALPDEALKEGGYRDYRLAVASLPSLQAARRAFVARLVHTDESGWSAALDDLIAWNGASRDDAAVWPGRAGQEALVSAAAGDSSAPIGSS